MFDRVRRLFAKPVTVESVRAELALVSAKRERARAEASRSPLVGGLIFDPFTRVLKLKRREDALRAQLAGLSDG
jgi:hypothetical protein